MRYDNGEILPGLNETWTFLGATMMEWASGFVVFILIGSMGRSPASAMPFMLIGWISMTVTLASLRKLFPDEERGLRNALMTACGLCPPNMPAPSRLQPRWSAAPLRSVPKKSKFAELELELLFPSFGEEQGETEEL